MPVEGWREKPRFHLILLTSSEQTGQEPLREARGQQVQPTLRGFLGEVEPGAGSSQRLGNSRQVFLPATPLGGPHTSRGRWGGQELPSPPWTSHLPPVQGRLGHLLCEGPSSPTISRLLGLWAKVSPRQRSPFGQFSSLRASISPLPQPAQLSETLGCRSSAPLLHQSGVLFPLREGPAHSPHFPAFTRAIPFPEHALALHF